MRFCALMLCALAASNLASPAPSRPAPAAATAKAEERLPHISIQTIGTGDPVVLIPGLSTPRAVWSQLVPELAKDHQVILVQVNGFAGDDPGANGEAGVLDGIVEDIHAYLAANRPGAARVIGHSMGGLVAMKLAIAHPESVDRLMVVDALPFFGTLFDDKATVESVRPIAETMRSRMLAAATAIKAKASSPVTSDPGGDMSLTPEGRISIANWSMRADPRVVAQAVYEDVTTDLRGKIAAIKVPMTVLYHTGDDPAGMNSKIYARDYSARPETKLVPVAGAAHFIMLDQPQRFASAVAEFLK